MIDHGASRRVLERAGFTFECEVVHAGERCALYRLSRLAGGATAA
jgi:RimJ/RimL family protein N-acetyltransferase